MKLFKISGYLSISFGLFSCLILLFPNFVFLSLIFSFLGFIFSVINTFLNAKYEINKGWFSIGYIGMLLSSIPILILFSLFSFQ